MTCSHKMLKKQLTGGVSWYVCANPDCDAPKTDGGPQKYKIIYWDGRMTVRYPQPADGKVSDDV